MGEDRSSYRREGGPGGADKRGEAGAGATQSFQFVRNTSCLLVKCNVYVVPLYSGQTKTVEGSCIQ